MVVSQQERAMVVPLHNGNRNGMYEVHSTSYSGETWEMSTLILSRRIHPFLGSVRVSDEEKSTQGGKEYLDQGMGSLNGLAPRHAPIPHSSLHTCAD